jgi:hypothetical protein
MRRIECTSAAYAGVFDRDLDPKAEEFIVGWPRTCPVTKSLRWCRIQIRDEAAMR